MAIFQRGTHFAGHVIGQLLGTGRFSEVYEATAADGLVRAMKVLKVDVPLGAKAQARLAQECEIVATIEHAQVVGFYGAGLESGRAWLLMECVRGPNLRQLVRAAGGLLPIERAVSIVQKAADGVAAAHRLGIVHRDLKPENVLVGPDDLVKVADFGSANVGDWGVRTTASEQDLSSSLYAAPEYLRHKKAELTGDVYAMGVMLYELVAGEHPVADGPMSAIDIVRRHLLSEPVALATRSTAERPIPDDLSELVQRAMAKEPAKRCSMRELADRLAVLLTRLRAPRRAVARNLPLPGKSAALAPTEQAMPMSGPGGTTVMAVSSPPIQPTAIPAVQAVLSPPVQPTTPFSAQPISSAPAGVRWSPASFGPVESMGPETGRAATPPPAPSGAGPPTLRTPSLARPVPITLVHDGGDLRATAQRRSTGAPVERSAPPPPRARPRAPPLAIAVVGAVLAIGLGGAAWLLFGAGGAATARAPPAPARAAATASASAAPSAVSPAPTAEVSAARPRASAGPSRARPPPPRPRLPSP